MRKKILCYESLDRPGRKQANVSVRMASISFGALSCRGEGEKKLDDSSRLDVVEIARGRDMLLIFFLPGWVKNLSAPRYYAFVRNKLQLFYQIFI